VTVDATHADGSPALAWDTSEGGVLVRTPVDQTEGDGSIPIPPLQLRVYPVAFTNIRHLIVGYHYLHRASTIPLACFGVLDSKTALLVGAVVFGAPVGGRGPANKGTLELNRFWLDDRCGKNSESRVLAFCIRWIRKAMPNIHRIISYSDTSLGHLGTIYRATGWTCLGPIRIRDWSMPGRKRENAAVNGQKLKWELAL